MDIKYTFRPKIPSASTWIEYMPGNAFNLCGITDLHIYINKKDQISRTLVSGILKDLIVTGYNELEEEVVVQRIEEQKRLELENE